LPADLLVKYLNREENHWRVKDSLRRHVTFKELNLISSWPTMPSMDVVFLRNVLIYFDTDVKKMILGKVRRLLRPGGYLFLGGAETTLNLDDAFERIVCQRSTYYRAPGG
jgi:chemotaxis protein methyltransferase CheR